MNTRTSKLEIERKRLIEILILAVIALVCIFYIVFREKSQINYSLPVFKALSQEEITRLEILQPGGEAITLERLEDGWLIKEDGFKADGGKVNRLLDLVTSPEVTDMVSQAGKPERYDLDETTRTSLRAFSSDNLIRELYLGKPSASGNYTYVLFPGDKNVYTFRGNLQNNVNVPKEDLRDRVVLQMDRDGIGRIQYSHFGSSGTLHKEASDEWKDQNGASITPESVNDLLSRVSRLMCTSFLDEEQNRLLNPDSAFLRVSFAGDKDYHLTIYPYWEDETVSGFPAQSSELAQSFLLPQYTAQQILDFFQEPPRQ